MYCLIQATLGEVIFEHPKIGHLILQESQWLLKQSSRIMRCMIDFAEQAKDAIFLVNALDLSCAIIAKVWHDSPCVLRQLSKIGKASVNTLRQKGVFTVNVLRQADPRDIELWLKRNPPFGNQVHDLLDEIPNFDLCTSVEESDSTPFVIVEISLKGKWKSSAQYKKFMHAVISCDGNLIVHRRIP